MNIRNFNITMRILREMGLNYKEQYPLVVPDLELVAKIVGEEVE